MRKRYEDRLLTRAARSDTLRLRLGRSSRLAARGGATPGGRKARALYCTDSESNPRAPLPTMSRVFKILGWFSAALLLCGLVYLYFWIQAGIGPVPSGENDTAGYFTMAKRIARFEPLARPDPDPFLHQSHVWVENAQGLVIPKYPPGYPVALCIAEWVGGDRAMDWVSPVSGALALLGLFALTCQWTNPWMGLLAAGTLLISPTFHRYCSYPLTHALMMAVVVWGMFFLWRWIEKREWWSGLAAGLLLGFAAMIRHTGVLLVLPVIFAVLAGWMQARRQRQPIHRWGMRLLLGGYAFMILLLAAYNTHFFGKPWITGFFLTQEQVGFTLSQIPAGLRATLLDLNQSLTPLLFPLGLMGIIAVRP